MSGSVVHASLRVDRAGLAAFLRRRRESIAPAGVGPRSGTRRRTPGLRREEVAALAGMSANYYEQLEQRRGPRPSDAVLAALARALRLSDDETTHLYALAGHGLPRADGAGRRVEAGLHTAFAALAPGTVALICDERGDVLAENAASVAVFGPLAGGNIVRRWFTDPAWRDATVPAEDQERVGRAYVADLRASLVNRPGAAATAFVRRLRAASAEFAALWDRQEVAALRSGTRVLLCRGGRLDVECAVLPGQDPGQRLVLFRPIH